MREIIFRGKRKDNGEWIYGYLTKHMFAGYTEYTAIVRKEVKAIYKQGTEYVYNSYEVIPETVGQYTGLTDKNGNKIFEWDIHKFNKNLFVAKYGAYCDFESDAEGYGWFFRNIKTGDCYTFYGNEKDYVNIIGNIHDNSELLEVQERGRGVNNGGIR